MSDQYDNIPQELKEIPQWVTWRYEDRNSSKPTKIPYNPTNGKLAKVNDPETFAPFNTAVEGARQGWYDGIGMVLTNNDDYTIIDLDDTKGDAEKHARQVKIFESINSYTELSPSKKGLHIVCKGRVPSGRKRDAVEIYSNLRYITFTGDVYRDAPISDQNDALNALHKSMEKSNASNAKIFWEGASEITHTDQEIVTKGYSAANGGLFADLWEGKWHDHYESQSEADLSLVNLIAFFTQNREQIERLFRLSALGQREKAARTDYMNWMVNLSFDRMLPPIDLDGLQNQINEAVERNAVKSPNLKSIAEQERENNNRQREQIFSPPPGLVGDISQFIYQQSPMAMPEASLTAALAMMSGITGRCFNVSGTGLNQYLLFLANTGYGKEAMARGIDRLFSEIAMSVPAAMDFAGPAEIASPQAILKFMCDQPSICSVVGEFGYKMQQMSQDGQRNPNLEGIKRFILQAYNKSGKNDIFHPMIYSDKGKNTEKLRAPALTILGESTPETFYEGLHEGLINDGLVPRFTIIEYTGDYPELNEHFTSVHPSQTLIDRLSDLSANCLSMNNQAQCTDVTIPDNYKQFRLECSEHIKSATRDVIRNIWTRQHVKAMKMGAIVAVGEHPYEPTISPEVAEWSINIARHDAMNFVKRFESGDIGLDNREVKQVNRMIATIRNYIISDWEYVSKYSASNLYALYENRVIPYCFISRSLSGNTIYSKDRIGGTNAIKKTLQTLIDRGDIEQVSARQMSEHYGTTSIAYVIKNITSFNL